MIRSVCNCRDTVDYIINIVTEPFHNRMTEEEREDFEILRRINEEGLCEYYGDSVDWQMAVRCTLTDPTEATNEFVRFANATDLKFLLEFDGYSFRRSGRVTYLGGAEEMLLDMKKNIKQKFDEMSVDEIFSSEKWYKLLFCIEHPDQDYAVFFTYDGEGYLYNFDDFLNYLSRLKKGDTFYIGEVMVCDI